MNKRPVGRPRIHPGRVRTNAERCRAYRERQKRRKRPAYFAHTKDLWETPHDFYDALNAEFHFTLDACALPQNAKCDRYFSPDQDGLLQDWRCATVWLNPPYSQIAAWVTKAYEASKAGASVVCLLPSRTDRRWLAL